MLSKSPFDCFLLYILSLLSFLPGWFEVEGNKNPNVYVSGELGLIQKDMFTLIIFSVSDNN